MPCAGAFAPSCSPYPNQDPVLQSCKSVGTLVGGNVSVVPTTDGVNITLHGGFDVPPMPSGRNAVYQFICDKTVPATNGPDASVTESPPGFYNVVWRTPAVCSSSTGTTCAPPPPAPPPPPPPVPCSPGSEVCLPSWKPTWDMRNSTGPCATPR